MADFPTADAPRVHRSRRLVASIVATAMTATWSGALWQGVASAQQSNWTTSAEEQADQTGDGAALPPATPGPPPPEEAAPPPPAIPPVAPPGADDAGRVRAAAELKASQLALRRAKAQAKKLGREIVPFQRRMFAAQARMADLTEEERRAADDLADARLRVRKMAVAGYVLGGDGQQVDYLLRSTDPIDLERRRSLVTSATNARTNAIHVYETARRAASGRLQEAVSVLQDAERAFEQVDVQVAATQQEVATLELEVENRRQLLELATAMAPVGATDIPRLFLDAYKRAAATMAKRVPTCKVPWTALAAIGRIESNHGRYRGAQLALNGDVYPRILGIPLDGTRSALIRDTDLGVYDEDTVYDRAVGPMQFIPSTWTRVAEDGNGDGVRDPNNAYDATLGAAAYLCRAVPTGNLDTDEGLRPGFFSYNRSEAYVEAVLTSTHHFAALAASV